MMKSTGNVGLVVLLMFMASCERQRDNKPSAAQPSGFYQTPAAVFNAYREAVQKRDWRKCFDCFTPDRQKNTMFELVLDCRMGGAEIGGPLIVKKFVDGNWEADFKRKFKEKFGMEPQNIYGYLRAPEHQLRCDVLAAHVRDKAGFAEAFCNLPERASGYSPLGELKQLTVEGDTASGQAEMVNESQVSYGNGVHKVVCSRYDKTFHFRKVNGGWLIEQDF